MASAFVLAGACLPAAPLEDARSGRPPGGMILERGGAYAALAPIGTVLDTLTRLTVAEHVAVTVTLLGAWQWWAVRRVMQHAGRTPAPPVGSRARGTVRRFASELAVFLAGLLMTVALYATLVIVPRPMARLALADPAAFVVVDFHSHTNASWDARAGFTPEANRVWHRAAGFDAAYVTDHGTWRGAAAGARANPARAGDGTVLLPGIELRDHGEHVNVLGPWTGHPAVDDGEWREDVRAPSASDRPVLLLTVPAHLDPWPVEIGRGAAPLAAVELVDAAPLGLTAGARDRAPLLRLADRAHLAFVAGSDNHGWGRTAIGWSVLHVPGWRSLTPAALERAIRRQLREQPRAARVIARPVPTIGRGTRAGWLALPFTVPLVAWRAARELSPPERVAWLLWLWAPGLIGRAATRAWLALRAGTRATRWRTRATSTDTATP